MTTEHEQWAQLIERGRPALFKARAQLHRRQSLAVEARQRLAEENVLRVMPVVEEIRAGGVTKMNAIVAALNARGLRTCWGYLWTKGTLRAVLNRAKSMLCQAEGSPKAQSLSREDFWTRPDF